MKHFKPFKFLLTAAIAFALATPAYSEQISVGRPGPVLGTTTNDSANIGFNGEYIESIVLVGSAVALTTATPANVTSISLTAGDWDVTGEIYYSRNGSTSVTATVGWVSSTSATVPTPPAGGVYSHSGPAIVGSNDTVAVHTTRFSLSGTTTVYLSAQETFTVSTSSVYGILRARRVR